VGTPFTLNGTVTPPNATNQNIVWTVSPNDSGTTGGTVSGNMVNATAPGTLMVMATIKDGRAPGTDFTHEVSITFIDPFVAVTDITGVPTSGTIDNALILTRTVVPYNATNQTIAWSVNNPTGTVNGDTVTATAAGTLVVTATIANGTAQGEAFTKDFTITFIDPSVVTDITGVLTSGTVDDALILTGTVVPSTATNKTITWEIKDPGDTEATIENGDTVTAKAAGILVVTATIANGTALGTDFTKDFTITFIDLFFQYVPVTDIIDIPNTTGIPTTWLVGTELILNGKVSPEDATEKDVKYSVKDAGTTGIPTGIIGGDKKVTATMAGTLVVTATVLNGKTPGTSDKPGTPYTKDLTIEFKDVAPAQSRR